MEEHRQVLPFTYMPQQLSLDASRPRYPLVDSAGNAQGPTSSNTFNDHKGALANYIPQNFSVPTLPSQYIQKHPNQAPLETRKPQICGLRNRRNRSPIIGSENYQIYRSRPPRNNGKDVVWPDDLEDLFLDALLDMPKMGRQKFCFNGKPRGRNELISLYLWIGHCESLIPGQQPDETKRRDRKQVSSHIQVLKKFMRGHPSFHMIFPRKSAKNEAKDSFKDDPCLRALAQHRLPYRRRNRVEHVATMFDQPFSPCLHNQAPRPYFFSMWVTALRPSLEDKDPKPEENSGGCLSIRVHTYSESRPRAVGNESLEVLPNWRTRFPALAQLHPSDLSGCDIIHMETSIELQGGNYPKHFELWGRFEILVPGTNNAKTTWNCTQSMHKPACLYGKQKRDPPYESISSELVPVKYIPGVGTSLLVTFPAVPWAHALDKLSEMEDDSGEALRHDGSHSMQASAQQYIKQISMYQDFSSSPAPNQPWQRRVILLWTFRKCRAGERGESTWRYLYPGPSHQQCHSPRPRHANIVSTVMPENFPVWADTDSLPAVQLQHSITSSFDRLAHELDMAPLHIARGMQSPFPIYGYHDPNLTPESLSFVSHEAQDSGATLADSQGNNRIDHFTQGADMSLGDFDQSQGLWSTSPTESFNINTAFQLANFNCRYAQLQYTGLE